MARTKQTARKAVGGKRRREDDDLEERPTKKAIQSETEESKSPQRPKETQSDVAVASLDPSLLADYFAKAVRKHSPDSSSIELEEQYLPTKAFRNTTSFDKDHVAANLPEFLEKFTENGRDALVKCENFETHTLVITSSGMRTADVARELRGLNSAECHVAKLIAKHMKLKDNVTYMKKYPVGIAISTPMRLRDLADTDDALKLGLVKRIVVDASHKDEKKRSIFEMNELFLPLVEFLNRAEFRQRYGTGVEILVF